MRTKIYRSGLIGLCLVAAVLGETSAQVAGWRTDGTGYYAKADPPLQWSATQNVLWATPLTPWSNASPVVSGDRIFVCMEPTTLVCISAKDGSILWKKSNDYTELNPPADPAMPKTHGTNGYSSASPVTDGKHVYARFGNGVAACYDMEGNRKWITLVEKPKADWGSSASPVLAGDRFVVLFNGLHGLDTADGSVKWHAKSAARWGSLVPVTIGRALLVATPSGEIVRPSDGSILARDLGGLTYNAPIAIDKNIYYIDGQNTVRASTLEGNAETVTPTVRWNGVIHKDRYYSSPILHDGLIYAITQGRLLSVLNDSSGELVYKEKVVALGDGTVYPSITFAGGYIFISNDNGKTVVLEPGRTYKQVGVNQLEPFRTSPVFVGDRLYIRTHAKLYCFGKPTQTASR